MDIGLLFKASIKTVKTRNKALGIAASSEDKNAELLRHHSHPSDFSLKTREILASITKMREFLLENRKRYVHANHLLVEESPMSEMERDKIDEDTQKFMSMCKEVLGNLKKDVKKNCTSQQLADHRLLVIDLLTNYMKAVCKICSEQCAIRVTRMIENQNLQKLHWKAKSNLTLPDNDSESAQIKKPNPKKKVYTDFDSSDYTKNPIGLEFSQEEIQMFEKENALLYNQLNSMADEVCQIEGQVVEISRLQEIFTNKIMEQASDIDRIADSAVGATEEIKEANEEIREAMKKSAGLRVWILFIVLVLSFSLLFLDWYNP